MLDLLADYLSELPEHISIDDHERLLNKAKEICSPEIYSELKSCFKYEGGWLFVGLDFDSLEDKISAVTTKDPNKIKVYSDGYDGHCLRALAYFSDQMPDIELCPDNEKAYKAIIGNHVIYFHANEDIEYLGKQMSGSELYQQIKG